MAVEAIHTHRAYPHTDTRYEWVEATVNFAVDPENPANKSIVDLEHAPRDADGLVRYDADLRLLRPVDGGDIPSNGKMLFVVPNRGVPTYAPWFKNGFLLERGWTIASCGWQWDVQRGPALLGLTAPQAEVPAGFMRLQWRSDKASDVHELSFSAPELESLPGAEVLFNFTDYPTVDVNDPEAVLTVRTSPEAEPTTIPRADWRFTDETHFTVDGGFQPFHFYELVYRTSLAPVAGCGLLAIRDVVSHLRADGIDHTFAYGVSQSGRLLRQFLSDGLNVDESGMQVFDGVFSDFAGAARGEFNQRYAQPSAAPTSNSGISAPFGHGDLLARQRELGGVPKTIFTNSATEYWQGDGALVHVDPNTGKDMPEDPDVRTYLIAGTDHFGSSQIKEALPAANPVHRLDVTPVNRALLIALENWVSDGVEPPHSQVPRTADGTAVSRKEVLSGFSHAAAPDPASLRYARSTDSFGETYVDLVSAIDADGNEVAGIRLPAVAAPLATYTGWNPRRHIDELPDVLYERIGSQLPFAPGRPSVTERWSTREDYAAAVRFAAESLVAERFLLADEVESIVKKTVAAY